MHRERHRSRQVYIYIYIYIYNFLKNKKKFLRLFQQTVIFTNQNSTLNSVSAKGSSVDQGGRNL